MWYNLLLKKDPRVGDLAFNVKGHSGRPYLTESMLLDVFYGVE